MFTSNKANLQLKNVGVTVGNQAIVRNLTIDFAADQIYTIIGPSGVGKSTLMNLLAGLRQPTEGTMSFGDTAFQPKDHIIGLVPQNYGLLPWETAEQAVKNAVKIRKKTKLTIEDQQAIDDLFDKLDLSALKKQYPSGMSGGQQQRVSLARAFAVSGDLLLMDEPFSALDAFTREKIQDLFIKIWQEHPQLTCFITHDIEEALLLGHQIVIMGGQPGAIQRFLPNPLQGIDSLEERRNDPRLFQYVNELRGEIWREEK